MKIRTIALVAALAGVAASGCSKTSDASDAPATPDASELTLPPAQRSRIETETVSLTSYNGAVETTGTVAFDGDQATSVLAPISGPVTRILVQPGAEVEQGQALAYVSSPDFAAAVADYRKAVAAAQNASRIAKLDEQLFQNDAIARRDMEQAQTDATAAEADLGAAVQQLRALGVDPEHALDASQSGQPIEGVIRSPISGTVVERLVTPGQLIQAGSTPVFTVADLSRVWVMANVFPSDLERVQKGDAADVTTGATPTVFHGTVDYIAALVDPDTKATQVRIVVPNDGQLLKRGMYVNVELHSRRPEKGLLVPLSAVLRDDDNRPFVFLESADGHYARRSIELGPRVGDRYAVTGGLEAGDHVISEGALFLQFAQSQ